MYAIYDSSGTQVTNAYDTKTNAWNNFRDGRSDRYPFSRSGDIARYRREGFYCYEAFSDLRFPASTVGDVPSPTPAVVDAPSVTFSHVVKVDKNFNLDLAFAKAMLRFFEKKQVDDEIEYCYQYGNYGSEGDAKMLLKHMTEFLSRYAE